MTRSHTQTELLEPKVFLPVAWRYSNLTLTWPGKILPATVLTVLTGMQSLPMAEPRTLTPRLWVNQSMDVVSINLSIFSCVWHNSNCSRLNNTQMPHDAPAHHLKSAHYPHMIRVRRPSFGYGFYYRTQQIIGVQKIHKQIVGKLKEQVYAMHLLFLQAVLL